MKKSKSIAWLENRREDEEIMADTINTEHPDYAGSEDEGCYQLHQYNITMLNSIIYYMKNSVEKPLESEG